MVAARRLRTRNLFWPLAAAGVVAIGLLTTTLTRMAHDFDRAARDREQELVENGFAAKVAEIGHQVVPQAAWDDAVIHLDNRFDQRWAHDNVGQYLSAIDGFSLAYVLDADNRPVYGMADGADVSPTTYQKYGDLLAPVVARLRALEIAAPATGAEAGGVRRPLQLNTAKVIDGRVLIFTATRVQPDFGQSRLTGPRAPVIVTGREIDSGLLESFSNRYMLTQLHLHPDDSRNEPAEAHGSITDDTGMAVATLDWIPEKPGSALLRQFLPWTLMLLTALLALGLLLYRRGRRVTVALEASEGRALHLAFHDVLTGMGNRRQLEVQMAEACVEPPLPDRGRALLAVDLDHFKELNDLQGHPVGDELLLIAAERLRAICGDHDPCSRVGGDEFAILCRTRTLAEIEALADRVLADLAEPYSLSTGRVRLTCSVGIALLEESVLTATEALRRADLALFRAKRDGRGRRVTYEPSLDEELRSRRRLQDDLRRDLADGRLTMVYQPQVDSQRRLIGVEALVRWTHLELGPISPATFVPMAEECGLIDALGEFTLRRAFEDSLRWRGLKVAVNVSAIQLRDDAFAARLIAMAATQGVASDAIEIELTEGVLVDEDGAVLESLTTLRDAGFSLAIDDFGTGYSSLSYLSRFPIGKIKIDRSFVVDLGQSESADALVSTIVQLGRSLNMRVLAEGVETVEQWLRLSAAGCHEFQGYLTSRPLTANLIDELVARGVLDAPATPPRPQLEPQTLSA